VSETPQWGLCSLLHPCWGLSPRPQLLLPYLHILVTPLTKTNRLRKYFRETDCRTKLYALEVCQRNHGKWQTTLCWSSYGREQTYTGRHWVSFSIWDATARQTHRHTDALVHYFTLSAMKRRSLRNNPKWTSQMDVVVVTAKWPIFTTPHLVSALYTTTVSVRTSVCLSVTSRYCIDTDKRIQLFCHTGSSQLILHCVK